MKRFYLLILGLVFITLSCEKTNLEQDNKTTDSGVYDKENISCENGILIFKNYASLTEYESAANLMDIGSLTKLERGLGFESQKRIFENIAIKEYDLQIRPFEDKTEEEMKNIPFPGHCPEYLEAIKLGFIKEINEPEGSYIDYNLTDRSMAAYLNKDGFVMVGSVLYFVKDNTIKRLENASVYDGKKVIAESNNNKSEVLNTKSVMSGTYTAFKHDPSTTEWKTVGNFRTKMSATFIIKTFGLNSGEDWSKYMECHPLSVGTNSQRKNGWGNWNQYWGPETIDGTASLTINWSQDWFGPYIYPGINNNFSTYRYLPSASNATVKYHPLTGEPAPFLDYVIAEAPNNGYYGWNNKPISFHITANLPGGCCGFTREVEW